MKLYTKAFVEKQEDDSFIAVASTESQDRQGEVVEVGGWELKNFKKNPIILWGHDHMTPIGKAERVWIEKSGKPKLMFKAFISDATTRGREIKQLMQEGILRAFSVGFMPIDADENRYTKQELLEISVVSVPANPQAMTMAYKSLKGAGFTHDEMGEIGVPAHLYERISDLETRVDSIAEKTELAVKGLKHLNPHTKVDKRVAKDRLFLQKVAVRAADKLAHDKRAAREINIIKRAVEKTIVSLKGEINGKN